MIESKKPNMNELTKGEKTAYILGRIDGIEYTIRHRPDRWTRAGEIEEMKDELDKLWPDDEVTPC